jgi:hypothetical protein
MFESAVRLSAGSIFDIVYQSRPNTAPDPERMNARPVDPAPAGHPDYAKYNSFNPRVFMIGPSPA